MVVAVVVYVMVHCSGDEYEKCDKIYIFNMQYTLLVLQVWESKEDG